MGKQFVVGGGGGDVVVVVVVVDVVFDCLSVIRCISFANFWTPGGREVKEREPHGM